MLFDERIMAFIPSSDLARSREFYEGVLDLTVEDFNDYACLVRSAEGGLVRITKVDDLRPQPFGASDAPAVRPASQDRRLGRSKVQRTSL